jgi:hypothetical protein
MGENAMSGDYGYGYVDEGGNPELSEPVQEQGPNWFRDYMDKVSGQLKELRAENETLRQKERQSQVAETLRAKGYTPDAAKLFTGEPETLDEWLGTYGNVLAKLPAAPGEPNEESEPETPQGPPQSTIPADQQAQMRQFAEAGMNAAPPEGSDKELADRIRNASPDEFAQIMQAHGNRYDWT